MTHRRLMVRVLAFGLLAVCRCWAGQHPVPVTETSDCLECHADYGTGDHVHPAVKRGCMACHRVDNRANGTYVDLKPADSVICLNCHRADGSANIHFPYRSGMCTRCHNPHASANEALLRAKVNELCLDCHLRRADSVPSRYLPTIGLVEDNSRGHPYQRHPVSGSGDPIRGGEMSCLSCHLPHGGTKEHYLRMAAEIPEDALNHNTETDDMCRKCHMILWGLDGKAGKKHKKK